MQRAIDETNRRRAKQIAYNEQHGIVPTSIVKQVHDLTERVKAAASLAGEARPAHEMPSVELNQVIKELDKQMKEAARALEFEKAAMLRDEMMELKGLLALQEAGARNAPIWEQDRVLATVTDDEGVGAVE
jgi:excinuclease ABC subunit B